MWEAGGVREEKEVRYGWARSKGLRRARQGFIGRIDSRRQSATTPSLFEVEQTRSVRREAGGHPAFYQAALREVRRSHKQVWGSGDENPRAVFHPPIRGPVWLSPPRASLVSNSTFKPRKGLASLLLSSKTQEPNRRERVFIFLPNMSASPSGTCRPGRARRGGT